MKSPEKAFTLEFSENEKSILLVSLRLFIENSTQIHEVENASLLIEKVEQAKDESKNEYISVLEPEGDLRRDPYDYYYDDGYF
ncbi:MAG: hypothetical protein F6K41_32685 [Symploca sp. SIO3E6]|nr:hypothetical protein [Caldora sp. SIO3E6]